MVWSLATLDVQDLPLLDAISAEARAKMPNFRCQDVANSAWAFATLQMRAMPLLEVLSLQVQALKYEMQAQNLSNTAWAFATLTVLDCPLLAAISEAAGEILLEFDLQGLANSLWAFASLLCPHFPLFSGIRRIVVRTATAESPVLDRGCRAADTYYEVARYSNHLCQLVWSFSFAGKLDRSLAHDLRGLMLQTGRCLDEDRALGARQGGIVTAPSFAESQAWTQEPELLLKLRGISVVLKPPGWEVDAKGQLSSSGLYLSRFMQREHDPCSRVLLLPVFEYGFIHRLDVPSSGLILTGTNFEGYSLLQWQMHTYSICREYSVLLCGLAPADLTDVNVSINDYLPMRSFVDENGRPAETHLKAAFHVQRRLHLPRHRPEAFGLVCIAIHTGRRHQIRVHTQWQGHPTVTDEKYAYRSVAVTARGSEKELLRRG